MFAEYGQSTQPGSKERVGLEPTAPMGSIPDLSSPQRRRLFRSFGPPIPRSRPGTWQWVDFPETAAASGTPTGLAVNFSPRSGARILMIYFQAGGACWDYFTSSLHMGGYGAVLHLDGFGEKQWRRSPISAVHRRMWLFDRKDASNPFRDAHFVYVPYCTGDIYVGDRVRTFKGPLPGMKKTIHFRGQHNVREYFRRLMPTFDDVERIYLVGSSAGGYGASFSWWLANEAWRTVPVDVISDAGHPVFVPAAQFDRWIETWGPQIPDDGPECARGLRQVLEYAERRYLGPERYALVTTRKDAVMSLFFAMRPATHADYVDRLRTEFFDDQRRYPGTASARYFIMDGHGHTVFPLNHVRTARIGPMRLTRWLRQMVEHDPQWCSWYVRDGVVESRVPGRVDGAGR